MTAPGAFADVAEEYQAEVFFRKAIERAEQAFGGKLDRARCFSCGDTPRDVEGGHGAGLRVVGVATGEFTVDELREAGADAVIGSFCEGLPLL